MARPYKEEMAWRRRICCVVLLMMMAACGMAGSNTEDRRVSLPVTRMTYGVQRAAYADEDGSITSIRERLDLSRAEEIRLLDEAIEKAEDAQTVRYAQTQKTEIAKRMELEAMAYAVLSALGYEKSAVCCGAEILTVFLPPDALGEDSASALLIDALAQQTGLGAEAVKIILAKNET